MLVFFLTAPWRKPIDFSADTMAQAVARLETLRNAFTLPAAAHDERPLGAPSRRRSTTISTRRAALAVLHEWASAASSSCSGAGSAIFGLESLAERDEAPPEVVELARRRAEARAARGTSRRPTGCATSSPRSAGRCGTDAGGFDLIRA